MATVLQQHREDIIRFRDSLDMTSSALAEAADIDLRGLRRFFNDGDDANPTTATLEKLYDALRKEERRQKRRVTA